MYKGIDNARWVRLRSEKYLQWIFKLYLYGQLNDDESRFFEFVNSLGLHCIVR